MYRDDGSSSRPHPGHSAPTGRPKKGFLTNPPPMARPAPETARHGIGASGEGDDSGQGECKSRRGERREYPIQGISGHPGIRHSQRTR